MGNSNTVSKYEDQEETKYAKVTPDINLNDIQPITFSNEQKLSYLEVKTNDGVIQLPFAKEIASGSFGSVALYGNSKVGTVALKVTDDEQEKKVVSTYAITDCNLVGCRLIPSVKSSSHYFIAMTYCDGTLLDIMDEVFDYDVMCKHKLIFAITDQISCLYTKTNPLCYIDLKPANILFKCESKKLRLLVGDLGSIQECDPANIGPSTFPYPFNYNKDDEVYSKANEQTVVWGLFIVLMCIYCTKRKQYKKISDFFNWYTISYNSNIKTEMKSIWSHTKYKDIFTDYATDKTKHTFSEFNKLIELLR